MSLVDGMRIDQLIARVEAIETRQREYGMHDPECPARRTEVSQRYTDAYLVPRLCECWLVLKGE